MTLKEVAKAAGVSHTTVSLVINHPEGSRVSPKTREKVLAAIRKLNYNPNKVAKRLALGRSEAIGIFIPYEKPIFRNQTIIELIAGIQDVLNSEGLDLVLYSSGRKGWKNSSISQIAGENTVDGLIIFNTRYTQPGFVDQYIQALSDLRFQFSMIAYYWGTEKVNYVGTAYEADAFTATAHLTGLGHREIACIAGTKSSTVTEKILSGFRRALEAGGCRFQSKWVVYTDYEQDAADLHVSELLERFPEITALFSAGYEMIPGCLRAARRVGRRVPDDLSVISYVDAEILPFLDPPVTAIRMPFFEMGRQAAKMVLNPALHGGKHLFDSKLIIRASTGSISADSAAHPGCTQAVPNKKRNNP